MKQVGLIMQKKNRERAGLQMKTKIWSEQDSKFKKKKYAICSQI